MSEFGKNQVQRVMDSAASIAIQKYMQQEDAQKLAALRESLNGKKATEIESDLH